MVVVDAAVKSWKTSSAYSFCCVSGSLSQDLTSYLLEEICCQHEDLGIRTEALNCAKISYSFLVVFRRSHHLEYVERRP